MTSDFRSAFVAGWLPAPVSFHPQTTASIDRDVVGVGMIVGFALLTASTLLLNYGSFARALAAFGLAPAH